MPSIEILAVITSAVVTAAVTPLILKHAASLDLMDIPNERSCHKTPLPRGGGIGVIVGLMAGSTILFFGGELAGMALAMMAGAALLVGGLGYLDDRQDKSVQTRLLVHFGAAALALYYVGGLSVPDSGLAQPLSAVVAISSAVGLVWALNLFNFMDGIDGIALQEAIFVSVSGAFLLWRADSPWVAVLLCLAGACLVAVAWNWSPAKIFLGDVGSGFLGFFLALVALDSVLNDGMSLIPWLILWGIFLMDATVTLTIRLVTRQRWYAPHRSHAYQQLARRGESHAAVSSGALLVNFLWLLPWAFLAAWEVVPPVLCLIVSLSPLAVMAYAVGAGRAEERVGSD